MVFDDEREAQRHICGGCGAESLTGHPLCVSAAAPHQEPPAAGYPHPDWLLHNLNHPTGAHDVYIAGLRELPAMLEQLHVALPPRIARLVPPPAPAGARAPERAAPAAPQESCRKCGAVILPPKDIGYCRACGEPFAAASKGDRPWR